MRWTEVGRRSFRVGLIACLLPSTMAAVAQQQTPLPAVPAPLPRPVQPGFVVIIDAAHGGADPGARINDRLLEKDLILAVAGRLRSLLAAQGVQVLATRESDKDVSALDRAQLANHAQAAACISLHATATGSGVHLFTSSLAATAGGRFLPWQTVQSAYMTQSLRLSSEIDSALAHAAVPVTLGRTALQPMDSFACPAVAVEIAPLEGGSTTKAAPLIDAAYQKKVMDALTAAVEQWRNDWRQQP